MLHIGQLFSILDAGKDYGIFQRCGCEYMCSYQLIIFSRYFSVCHERIEDEYKDDQQGKANMG